jgi:hypothetical protein
MPAAKAIMLICFRRPLPVCILLPHKNTRERYRQRHC